MSENEVYLIPRDLDWLWGGVPVDIRRVENMGWVSFDDIRVGDVVTYERGVEGEPGYMRAVKRVVEPDESNRHGNRSRGWLYSKQQKGYLRIVSIDRPKPVVPDHAGAMAFVDGGVAVCDGGDDDAWATVPTFLTGAGDWVGAPLGDDPVEAIPVPAEALRRLAVEEANSAQLLHHGADELLDELEKFRLACVREWGRAGIGNIFR